MSVKNNLDFIKSEFSSDEKIIENAFKLEILYKRYKHIIWGALGVVAILAVFLGAKSLIVESNAQKSSEILSNLLKNPSDDNLRASLQKSNENLYNLFLLKESLDKGNTADLQGLESAKNEFVQYLANYHLGSFERDSALLEKSDKYALGDLAKIESAYMMIQNGKIADAKNILNTIPTDSQLAEIARILAHTTITKKEVAKAKDLGESNAKDLSKSSESNAESSADSADSSKSKDSSDSRDFSNSSDSSKSNNSNKGE